MENSNQKSEFISIIGVPNVGKSSLLNRLVGQKVSIVSKKPQTTRNKITGVLTEKNIQLVFIDSPGFHKVKNKLSEYMVKQINNSITDVDVCVLVVDATSKQVKPGEQELIKKIKNLNLKTILVINKIDLLKQKEGLLKTIDVYNEEYDFESIIPISVKNDDGINVLKEKLFSFALPSPHFFSDDAVTDQMERTIISELIREKILNNLNEEIPHGVAVEIDYMKKRAGKKLIDIDCVIYCEKESHKGIIIGKDGNILKKISLESRIDIEKLLQMQVNLKCWLKVKNKWRNNIGAMKNFGYNINEK